MPTSFQERGHGHAVNGDEQPTLLERARIGVWVLFVCAVFLPVGDLLGGTGDSTLLWSVHAGRLLWVVLMMVGLRLATTRRYPGAIALLTALSLVATSTFIAVARQTFTPMLIVAGAVPLVTASLFPWGALMQAVMVLLSGLLVVVIPPLMIADFAYALPTNTWFNLVVPWVISIYLAYELSRSRYMIERGRFKLYTLNRTLEQRITDRTERLARVNKDLASFAYSISHDLRTPLRTIDGFSRLVLDETADRLDETEKGHLNTVRAAAQRMGELIDALLKLTRIGQQELNREWVDLSAIARSIAADCQIAEPNRGVNVDVSDTPPVYADPVLVRNVVQNLFENAWKYTARSDSARIEFGAEEEDENTVYYVRDNGIGFDMAEAGKLFEAFQRLHGPGEFEGTGIGLATVRRIIRLHGGRVWADGKAGAGAEFHFTIPEPVVPASVR